jgi:hypothetical protein
MIMLTCLKHRKIVSGSRGIIISLFTQAGVINRSKDHAKNKGDPKNPILGIFGIESTVLQDVPPEPPIVCAYNRLSRCFLHRTRTSIFQGTLNESLTRIPGLQSVDFSLLITAITNYCLRSTSQIGGI